MWDNICWRRKWKLSTGLCITNLVVKFWSEASKCIYSHENPSAFYKFVPVCNKIIRLFSSLKRHSHTQLMFIFVEIMMAYSYNMPLCEWETWGAD